MYAATCYVSDQKVLRDRHLYLYRLSDISDFNEDGLINYSFHIVDEEMVAEATKASIGSKKGILILGVGILGSFIGFFCAITFFHLVSVAFILLFCMAITIVLILAGPLYFSFQSWDLDIESHRIIQINATIVAGILIFLTINNASLNAQNIQIKELFDPSKTFKLSERSLIAALTTLTLIPFAISSMIAIIWGKHPVRTTNPQPTSAAASTTLKKPYTKLKTFDRDVVEQLKQHNVTGLKYGATFTIAGFAWLIISMIIFVTIIFT